MYNININILLNSTLCYKKSRFEDKVDYFYRAYLYSAECNDE